MLFFIIDINVLVSDKELIDIYIYILMITLMLVRQGFRKPQFRTPINARHWVTFNTGGS